MQPVCCTQAPRLARGLLTSLCLAVAAVLGAPLLAAQPAAQAQDTTFLYLPAVQAPPPAVLYGAVTYEGRPAAGIPIGLWLTGNCAKTLVATTVTDSSGGYRFDGAPLQPDDRFYYAAFANGSDGQAQDARFVRACSTYLLAGYAGATTRLGDFDIADITQLTPTNGAGAVLPVTFAWTHRTAAGGSYQVQVQSPAGGGALYLSPAVTGASTFTLASLPVALSYATEYQWSVQFWGASATCYSNRWSYITFGP